jgi:hypothetical protein
VDRNRFLAWRLAAKAASSELAATGDQAKAIAKGKQIASANNVAGDGLTLDSSDFVFGNTTRSVTGKWVFAPMDRPRMRFKLRGRRTGAAPDGQVELFFSGLLAGGGFETTADATSAFINADICWYWIGRVR